jgi:hypothetical protein
MARTKVAATKQQPAKTYRNGNLTVTVNAPLPPIAKAPKQAAPTWLAKAKQAAAKAAPTLGKAPANGMAAMVQSIVNVNKPVAPLAGKGANSAVMLAAGIAQGTHCQGASALAHTISAHGAKPCYTPNVVYSLLNSGYAPASGKLYHVQAWQGIQQAISAGNGKANGQQLVNAINAATGGTVGHAHFKYMLQLKACPFNVVG